MRLLTSSDEYLGFWAPRIGRRASLERWRAFLTIARGYLLALVAVAAVLADAADRSWIFTAVASVAGAIGAGLVLMANVRLFRSNRRLMDRLGLKWGPGGTSPPPRDRARYEAWCSRNGLAPYLAELDT